MTLNTYTDEQAILAEIESVMAQPVYNEVADGVDMVWLGDGTFLQPYIAVDFGSPVATAGGRSIAVEEKQPVDQRVIVAAVASSAEVVRQIAGRVVEQFTGFVPSANAGPLRLLGGGGYTLSIESKPTVYVRETYFAFLGNQANVG